MVPEKSCATCGRTIRWRKKWERCWEDLRHCSAACRKSRAGEGERRIETAILEALAGRAAGATICPSEVARALFPEDEAWRARMEDLRRAARRLVSAGRLEITQGGRVVDPSHAKGPIRLRLRRGAQDDLAEP